MKKKIIASFMLIVVTLSCVGCQASKAEVIPDNIIDEVPNSKVENDSVSNENNKAIKNESIIVRPTHEEETYSDRTFCEIAESLNDSKLPRIDIQSLNGSMTIDKENYLEVKIFIK